MILSDSCHHAGVVDIRQNSEGMRGVRALSACQWDTPKLRQLLTIIIHTATTTIPQQPTRTVKFKQKKRNKKIKLN